MYLKDEYYSQLLKKIDDLAFRIHLLKMRVKNQEVSARVIHYRELTDINCRFAELKRHLGQLEMENDIQSMKDLKAIETCWSGLMNAVDVLLATLR